MPGDVAPIFALNVLSYVLSDAAYAGLAGCLLAVCWLNTASLAAAGGTEAFGAGNVSSRLLRRIFPSGVVGCLVGLILGQIARPWFVAAGISGSDSFAGNLALVPDILSSTHVGKVWCLGSFVLVILLVAILFAGRQIKTPAAWAIAAALVLFACAKAASGHAAGQGDFTLAEFSMFLHISGTAVWAGSVVASGLIVVPALAKSSDPEALWSYARLLSKTVTWALLAILLSGIYNADRELNGSLSGLWTSGWGRVLIAKAAFVCLALALGAIARFKCVQRQATGERAALMVRLLRAEAIVMIVILCLSALLANTPPATTEARMRQPHSSSTGPGPLIGHLRPQG